MSAGGGKQAELWVATAPKEDAVAPVQAPPGGWTAKLAGYRPTARQIIQVRILGVGVQKLKRGRLSRRP